MSDDGPVCFVTDLPMAWCGHCRAPKAEPMPEVLVDRFLVAQYHGTCAACGGHIAPEDKIGRLADQPGYACEDCLKP